MSIYTRPPTAQFTAQSGSNLQVNVQFAVSTLIVDNYTNQFIHFPLVGRYVVPQQLGAIIPYYAQNTVILRFDGPPSNYPLFPVATIDPLQYVAITCLEASLEPSAGGTGYLITDNAGNVYPYTVGFDASQGGNLITGSNDTIGRRSGLDVAIGYDMLGVDALIPIANSLGFQPARAANVVVKLASSAPNGNYANNFMLLQEAGTSLTYSLLGFDLVLQEYPIISNSDVFVYFTSSETNPQQYGPWAPLPWPTQGFNPTKLPFGPIRLPQPGIVFGSGNAMYVNLLYGAAGATAIGLQGLVYIAQYPAFI